MTINIAAYEGNLVTAQNSEFSLPHSTSTATAYSSASPITVAGFFQTFLDLSAMVAGDQVQLNIYEICVAAGTQRKLDSIVFGGTQASPLYAYPPLLLGHGWDITVTLLSATPRTIPFSLREVS